MGRYLTGLVPTAVAAFLAISAPLVAQETREDQLDRLFERLSVPELAEWEYIEGQIAEIWADSGSPAMNLLLRRGRAAMEAEEYDVAIEHFTALTDHAPDFAEGFNSRATAYFAAGLYGPALEDISRALSLEPRHFAAWQGLSILLRQMGDEDRALDAIRRAAAIHPHQPDIKEALERLERSAGGIDA